MKEVLTIDQRGALKAACDILTHHGFVLNPNGIDITVSVQPVYKMGSDVPETEEVKIQVNIYMVAL